MFSLNKVVFRYWCFFKSKFRTEEKENLKLMGFTQSSLKKSVSELPKANHHKPIAEANKVWPVKISIVEIGEPIFSIASEFETFECDQSSFTPKYSFNQATSQQLLPNFSNNNGIVQGILKNEQKRKCPRIFNEEAKLVRFTLSQSVPHSMKKKKLRKGNKQHLF